MIISDRTIRFFSASIDCMTMSETVMLIRNRIESGVFTQHSVVNVAKLVHMQRDKELADAVNACDIVNADGMGVVWGARLLGFDVPERVTGVDLFDHLLAMASAQGHPVFLLGAKEHVVARVAHIVQRQYPGLIIAGFQHGYFWEGEAAVVEKIRESGARLLFVAITSPKKETFINRWRDQLGVSFVMGVGGTFDVVAGDVKRAPTWIQASGLEWLYRVWQEPRRMWRRYLTTNARFAWMMTRAMFNARGLK
ncbi:MULTISPECIES: WecB/TagA/CpsF family glycosyltransferase [Paraburkholderia]|uniref:WecB/TagA/CpsF family glycosyltransferase n=1 Tax=Paraburkholderia TaxID=1822464 RepID=UPI0022514441|nr:MULTISPECIES: WecB/TagA/CpsF family glycosyltransferase [Paraburkholderia]MCX4161559.1 WecB/TagA/CpsF family glycosyltransferase [Paraburkholderia megapolitana]MDN7157055.1 WecB/TagA/CpsF family glycosyltransferase [Paraburkholderia sp. CHISQ3]MDQ6494100.1 WecB/TagA/CpsF family glycosyltransferase [Paraburkholderia megapolitana]